MGLLYEQLIKIKRAGISGSRPPDQFFDEIDQLDNIEERITKIFGTFKMTSVTNIIFFVMYDIEDNKVRTYISKYLLKKSLVRVQKSIFIGNSSREVFDLIKEDLKEVQSFYENCDSILIVPISTEYLKSMKIIGQKIDFEFILDNKNTCFI